MKYLPLMEKMNFDDNALYRQPKILAMCANPMKMS